MSWKKIRVWQGLCGRYTAKLFLQLRFSLAVKSVCILRGEERYLKKPQEKYQEVH